MSKVIKLPLKKKVQVKIDEEELMEAVWSSSDEGESYVDLETGEIVWVSDSFETEVTSEDIENNPDRYESVPRFSSTEVYEWMVEFTEGLDDENLKEKLWIALDGKGAFGRFKGVLVDYPGLEQKWYGFKGGKEYKLVKMWAKEAGIKIVKPKPDDQ